MRRAPAAGCAALFALWALGAWGAQERTRVGHALDAATGAPLYVERHVDTLDDGRVVATHVQYLDTGREVFASKRLDFRGDPLVPEFRLSDHRTGHQEGLRRLAGGALEVRFRPRADATLEVVTLEPPERGLADAGFDRFVESHWEELLAGRTLVRPFLVPSRLEFMRFRIRSGESISPDEVTLLLEVDSALLRLLVPAVRVTYERATRRLLRYEGISNLRDAGGDNLRVRVEFEYEAREPPPAPS